MLFATDFDGVLNDFSNYIRKRVYEITGYDIGNKYFFKIPGYTDAEVSQLVDNILDETEKVPPIKRNIVFLGKISKILLQPILIVTARKPVFKHVTENWLEKYASPYFDYIVRYAGSHKNKSNYLDDDTLYYVDDYYESIVPVSYNVKIAFLINSPYNENFKPTGNILLVKDMSDVYNIIRKEVADLKRMYMNVNENTNKKLLNYLDELFRIYDEDGMVALGGSGGGVGSGSSGIANSTGSLSSYETFNKPILKNIYLGTNKKKGKNRISRIKKEEIDRYFR